jgi:hypothetical protein
MTVFWDVSSCSLVETDRIIVLIMEAVGTSETSVNFLHTTRCNVPEDSRLHIRRSENLKSSHSQDLQELFTVFFFVQLLLIF